MKEASLHFDDFEYKTTPLLEVDHISIEFGGLKAVDDFSMRVHPNQLVGLIGPNGAGKTTVFNMLTGVYTPTSGNIYVNGNSILHKKPHKLVKIGLARTFQNIRLFKQMTVLDNVMVAFNQQMKTGILSSVLRLPKFYKEEKKFREEAMRLLKIFNLDEFAKVQAENLPYGKQRRLEIARAMATNPKVLLLDEPAAGMNPTETDELMQMIRYIKNNYDIAVLLIEHDMHLVMSICEKIYVLEYGKTIAFGTPEEIANNKRVIEAYLGSDGDSNA